MKRKAILASLPVLLMMPFIVFVSLFGGAQDGGTATGTLTIPSAQIQSAATLTGIPPKALEAYVLASGMSLAKVGCYVPWWLLAGVSLSESGHGTHGGGVVQNDFSVFPPINGVPLDGSGFGGNTEAIYFGGLIDVAVGPFQFIGSSWMIFGMDASGDGINDPQNIADGALAAANHLCHSAGGPGSKLTDESVAKKALYGYNASVSYGNTVWNDAVRYRDQVATLPGVLSAPTTALVAAAGTLPNSEGLDAVFAMRLARLAAATKLATGGDSIIDSGYRSIDEQREIIAAHGGVCGIMVACVYGNTCGSEHCQGLAADMEWTSSAADAYWHNHAGDYLLCQRMSWEPWHQSPIEHC